jgi:(1->4)-alpha-D-glucan 1-alpha-D-glucosylmutase
MEQVKELLRKTAEMVNSRRRLPEATYRLQFHAGFTFRDATQIVTYLRDLGITHVYASPYLKARPGSTHGYDITDHNQLNPEIGTQEDYAAWTNALRVHGLGQLLDVVPNHMGIVGNENTWWNDVLENGQASPFSAFFDIAWHALPRPELDGRVLIPILGDPYGKVLESGQLRLALENGSFAVHYFEHRFPIDPRSYDVILRHRLDVLEPALKDNEPALAEFQSILTAVGHLSHHSDSTPEKVAERQREKEVIKRRLQALVQTTPVLDEFLSQTISFFNGKPGERQSFDLLNDLLDRQPYRLSFWRVASDEINYRRFFDVNELAALSMESEGVFEATHMLVQRLLAEGHLDGLRIDHVDGLYDPQRYLQRLQQHYVLGVAKNIFASDPTYGSLDWNALEQPLRNEIAEAVREGQPGPLWRALYLVVEKILQVDESLPEDWSIHGTTGYDFLNRINGLFVQASNGAAFTRIYQEWIKDDIPFAELAYQQKNLILHVSLASELQMLTSQLDRLAQRDRWSRDFTLNSLRRALREVIACFPVYRSYIGDDGVPATDLAIIDSAGRHALARSPTMSRSIFRFVREILLLRYRESATEQDKIDQRRFVGKFQQVCAPVMAKGLEDTAFYVHNRLLSLNEVGGNPDRFGVSSDDLHRYLQNRQAKWPFGLSPLSTHDTKRSEDVRARLNVLSELPDEWRQCVSRWSQLNEPQRILVNDETAPDLNEEYFLYQTLLGAWPLERGTAEAYAALVQRIQAYMLKALHEAKVHTSWVNPNLEYDNAIGTFVARIMDENISGPFLKDFQVFQERVSHYGLLNSLSQTVLKIMCPGAADTYQGTELWDFSLVDPDNRRPVDYEARRRVLNDFQSRVPAGTKELLRELMGSKRDGRLKLYITWRALCCRRTRTGLFSTGSYEPVNVAGAKRDHVFSFLRQKGETRVLVAVSRFFTSLAESGGDLIVKPDTWQDTAMVLPSADSSLTFCNLFTGASVMPTPGSSEARLPAAKVFADLPVAVLLAEKRGALPLKA